MSSLGVFTSWLTAGLALAVLVGVFVRRKARACKAFPAYLATATLGHTLIVAAPAMFWNWTFLSVSDALQTTLALTIAFEIADKTFRALPGGYRRMTWVLTMATIALVLAVALAPAWTGTAYDLARKLERVSYGTSFIFVSIMAVVIYYGVPMDPFLRALATGFGARGVLVGCVSLLWHFDPLFGAGRDFVVKTAYPTLLIWWAWAAWRRDRFEPLSREAVRRLYPWRSS